MAYAKLFQRFKGESSGDASHLKHNSIKFI